MQLPVAVQCWIAELAVYLLQQLWYGFVLVVANCCKKSMCWLQQRQTAGMQSNSTATNYRDVESHNDQSTMQGVP